jgi:Conjugative transposon protein TcpC
VVGVDVRARRIVRGWLIPGSRDRSGLGRTPARLLRSAGRAVLWCVVAVLLVRGVSDVLARREPEPGARVDRSAVARAWPDDKARAFAVQFVWAYLRSAPQDGDGYARGLTEFATPELAAELVPRLVDDGPRQVVQAATVAGSAAMDEHRALVTVAVRVAIARRVSSRLVTVPVARDDDGGLVVYDLPSFASPVSRARAGRPASQPLVADRAEIEDVLARFLRAYLAGAADELTYLVPPGVRIGAAAGRFELTSLVSVAEPVPASVSRGERLVLVTVQARDVESRAVYALRYRVRLVRQDRWYVAAVNASGGER